MALYLGNSDKLKIYFNNAACCLKLFHEAPIVVTNMLLSSDNFISQDSNDVVKPTDEKLVKQDSYS